MEIEALTINVYEEGEFIKQLLMANFNSMTSIYSTQTHLCKPNCKWETLKGGVIFSRQGKKYITTGMVFVCKESLNVHRCGLSYCFNYLPSPDGEGAFCQITGLWLGEEYAVNTNWQDPDVRCVGSFNFINNTQHIVENKLDKVSALSAVLPCNDSEDPDGFLTNTKNFFKQAAAGIHDPSSVSSSSSSSSKRSFKTKNNKKNKTFDETMLSIGTEMDIKRVMQRYSDTSEQNQISKVQARVKRRAVAQEVWVTLTLSELYIEVARKVGAQASEKWDQMCHSYIKECHDNGVAWDYFKLLFMWLRYVAPFMKNVVYGYEIVERNEQFKDYYIECMLRIWEMLDDIELIQKNIITFNHCAPAILTKLSHGLTQTVYFKENDPKPYIKDVFNEESLINARAVDVEFIPAHPELVLVSTSEVRKQSPLISQQGKMKNKNDKESHMKFIPGPRAKGGSSRRTRKPTGIIPSTKFLNKIFRDKILEAQSMEDLRKIMFNYDI